MSPPMRIAGFGACMITGYPFEKGGFFEIACGVVEERLSRSLQSHITSLHKFPAPRAEKYMQKRVFGFKPDYVVIQFGSTDAACPLRRRGRQTNRGSKSSAISRNAKLPPNLFTLSRWTITSLLSFFWKVPPITPLSQYIAAIERMVDYCLSAEITPVVLSPFIFGSKYSTRNAIVYSNALLALQLRKERMILVDCIPLLSRFRKSMILLKDGFHLSRLAHRLIGEAVGVAIVLDVVYGPR
jgi:hypothetical protein